MNNATFRKNYYALFNAAGKVKNYRRAFPLLLIAAKNGHPHAQNLVGYCYDLGLGPKGDAKVAVHWYKKAAQNDYSEAIYNLAVCYEKGIGIPQK